MFGDGGGVRLPKDGPRGEASTTSSATATVDHAPAPISVPMANLPRKGFGVVIAHVMTGRSSNEARGVGGKMLLELGDSIFICTSMLDRLVGVIGGDSMFISAALKMKS